MSFKLDLPPMAFDRPVIDRASDPFTSGTFGREIGRFNQFTREIKVPLGPNLKVDLHGNVEALSVFGSRPVGRLDSFGNLKPPIILDPRFR